MICEDGSEDTESCEELVPKQSCEIGQETNKKVLYNCIGQCQYHMGDASVTNINFQYTKETECKKEPREVCGPESCPLVQGDKVCNTETKTVSNGVGGSHFST